MQRSTVAWFVAALSSVGSPAPNTIGAFAGTVRDAHRANDRIRRNNTSRIGIPGQLCGSFPR